MSATTERSPYTREWLSKALAKSAAPPAGSPSPQERRPGAQAPSAYVPRTAWAFPPPWAR